MFKHSKGGSGTNVQRADHCVDTSAAPALLLSDAFFSSVKPPSTPDAGENAALLADNRWACHLSCQDAIHISKLLQPAGAGYSSHALLHLCALQPPWQQ